MSLERLHKRPTGPPRVLVLTACKPHFPLLRENEVETSTWVCG